MKQSRVLLETLRQFVVGSSSAQDIVKYWVDPTANLNYREVPRLKIPVERDTGGGNANPMYTTLPFEEESGSTFFYIRVLNAVKRVGLIKSQLQEYTGSKYVVSYVETPPEVINLNIAMYNTVLSPWSYHLKNLIKKGIQKRIDGGGSPFELHVPQYPGHGSYDEYDCEVMDVSEDNSFKDISQINIQLYVIDQETITTIKDLSDGSSSE